MNNLIAHLSSLEENQKGLVVGNQDTFKKYEKDMEEFNHQLVLVDVEHEELPPNMDFGLVVVLGRNNREAHNYYTKCNNFKRSGIPVVFGTAERALFYESPGWQSADLTIAGMFYLTSRYIPGLPRKGSYVEFGVFDGRSFTVACHTLKYVCNSFHAFDSFNGIVGAREDERQLFQENAYFANIETFWHNMEISGVSDLPIKTVQGAFQETLKGKTALDYDIDSISVVHIDSDVYEAAILALEFVVPSLTDGALVLFDEFHAFGGNNNKGERRAFREWLESHPELSAEKYRDYTAGSRSYMIHRDLVNRAGVKTRLSRTKCMGYARNFFRF